MSAGNILRLICIVGTIIFNVIAIINLRGLLRRHQYGEGESRLDFIEKNSPRKNVESKRLRILI